MIYYSGILKIEHNLRQEKVLEAYNSGFQDSSGCRELLEYGDAEDRPSSGRGRFMFSFWMDKHPHKFFVLNVQGINYIYHSNEVTLRSRCLSNNQPWTVKVMNLDRQRAVDCFPEIYGLQILNYKTTERTRGVKEIHNVWNRFCIDAEDTVYHYDELKKSAEGTLLDWFK